MPPQMLPRVACRTTSDYEEIYANHSRGSMSLTRTWCVQRKARFDALRLLCAQQALEDNILRTETQYLEETTAGNIIKGFDNYIKGAATTTATSGAGTATRRKAQVSDVDRIFSRSSSSFLRVRW
jgi:hypothetical protein